MRLRAAGVADVEVLPPAAGATRAVVSLGIYGDRANAERRVEELRRYAVNAQVLEQPRADTAWWIDVDVAPGASPVDVGALERALAGAGALVGETCPAVAPATPAADAPGAAAPASAPAAPDAAPVAPGDAPPAPTAAGDPPSRVAFG
jgi:hypothetical protein